MASTLTSPYPVPETGTWEHARPDEVQGFMGVPEQAGRLTEPHLIVLHPDRPVAIEQPMPVETSVTSSNAPQPLPPLEQQEHLDAQNLELLALRQQLRVFLLSRPGGERRKLVDLLHGPYDLGTPAVALPIQHLSIDETRETRETLKREAYRLDGVNDKQGMVEVNVIDVIETQDEEDVYHRIEELRLLQVQLTPLVRVTLLRHDPNGKVRTVHLPTGDTLTRARYSKLASFRSLARTAKRAPGNPLCIDDVLDALHG